MSDKKYRISLTVNEDLYNKISHQAEKMSVSRSTYITFTVANELATRNDMIQGMIEQFKSNLDTDVKQEP